ncbi:hypothetical protein CTEN210_13796 [Chaetoceros tenuissimus]|uniref:L domain-like protein n=1 Tax=Chaetoceros tenuissimus TaxID=426638 RepID=A0AAD3HBC9_9STRA|nr:hypothetical protein CTEN210_13796 [Chaetoceros tenuissimus]
MDPKGDFDKTNMPADTCREVEVTAEVNTCKRFFSASLKVEGLRNGVRNDYCYAYDFLRVFPLKDSQPPTMPPTQAPTQFPTQAPTSSPTQAPTQFPTQAPTQFPTEAPTPQSCVIESMEDRKARIEPILEDIINDEDLQDPMSPQSQAKKWLLEEDTFQVLCAKNCRRDSGGPDNGLVGAVYQRYAAAVFYFSLGGDNDEWFECAQDSATCTFQPTILEGDDVEIIFGENKWLSDVSECEWGGIACRASTECVDRIEFEQNNINGQLPTELSLLFDIRYLIIEGALSEEQYRTNDELLYLNGELPKQVFNTLDQLKFLDLNFNNLAGEIPPGVYEALALEQLDLDFNQLSGEIKPEIGNLTNLTFLQISNNKFSGELPDTFQGLTQLANFDVHINNFTGKIPKSVCDLFEIELGRLNKLRLDCQEVERCPDIFNPRQQCF